MGLLRLIGRYLYAQEGRPLLNTKKTLAHIEMTKEFDIFVLSQQILKTLIQFCVTSWGFQYL